MRHTGAEIREHLERAGVGHLVERVLAATATELRITATVSPTPPLGGSRLGGAPDLPRGVPWPRHRWLHTETAMWPDFAQRELAEAIAMGRVIVEGEHVALALPFVAQLDLAELAPLQTRLPRRGHLWLFAEQTTTLGDFVDYPSCASACLYRVDAELVRATPPPVPEDFAPGVLAFAPGNALPTANDLGLGGDEWARYTAAIADLEQPAPRHAALARPDSGANGMVPPAGFTTLLRVDTDDALGTQWGDAAWLTFAIADGALAAGRFDEVRAFRWIG